ncbi:MAG: DciA family protein [Sphingomonadales bacterium]
MPDQRHGTARLDALLPKAARRAYRAFGFVESAIVTQWRHIVGPMLAAHSLPERLRFGPGKRVGGSLQIRVEGAFALELQHYAPLIIERVNGYFGYRAVDRLVIKQGPLPAAPVAAPVQNPPLTAAARQRIESATTDVHDERLKAGLRRLGALIAAQKPGP